MIQAATLQFLRNLRKHNERDWFERNKDLYLAARQDFEQVVGKIIGGLGRLSPALGSLEVKHCVYRIYRDIRFSNDKTPYKTHFAASFNTGGKMAHSPGFYLHLEPGGRHFVGGGIWMPPAPELRKIRQEIDYHFPEFNSIIASSPFRRIFGTLSQEDSLSRIPQGYDPANPAAGFLKLKSFIAGRSFTDAQVLGPRYPAEVSRTFSTLYPLIRFLSRALD